MAAKSKVATWAYQAISEKPWCQFRCTLLSRVIFFMTVGKRFVWATCFAMVDRFHCWSCYGVSRLLC